MISEYSGQGLLGEQRSFVNEKGNLLYAPTLEAIPSEHSLLPDINLNSNDVAIQSNKNPKFNLVMKKNYGKNNPILNRGR